MTQSQRRVYDLRHFRAGAKVAQNRRSVCSWEQGNLKYTVRTIGACGVRDRSLGAMQEGSLKIFPFSLTRTSFGKNANKRYTTTWSPVMFKKDKFDSSISMYEPAHLTKRIFFSCFQITQPKIVRQRTRSHFVGINFERIIFLARLEKSILVPLCVFYCWQQRHLHPLFFSWSA